MVQGKINRGRQTDHPNGRHSIWTNQCPPPPSTHFFTCQMPFLPSNQQCQSTESNQRIRIREKTLVFSSTVLPAPSPYRNNNSDRQNGSTTNICSNLHWESATRCTHYVSFSYTITWLIMMCYLAKQWSCESIIQTKYTVGLQYLDAHLN